MMPPQLASAAQCRVTTTSPDRPTPRWSWWLPLRWVLLLVRVRLYLPDDTGPCRHCGEPTYPDRGGDLTCAVCIRAIMRAVKAESHWYHA